MHSVQGEEPPANAEIFPCGISFLKGAARITTAIAVLVACHVLNMQACVSGGKHLCGTPWSLVLSQNLEVPEILRRSLQKIMCKHIRMPDRQAELLPACR